MIKALSYWAYAHKWAARLLIVLAYILLNGLALFFATVLETGEMEVHSVIPYLLSVPFLIAIVLYPVRRKKKEYRNFYLRQKTMDAFLVCTSFLLLVSIMNQSLVQSKIPAYSLSNVFAAKPADKPIKPVNFIKKKISEASFLMKQWHQIKKNYKELRKLYKEAPTGEQAALIFLASLIAGGLFLLLLGLSCNLTCSGNEGAAILVLLFGTALIVFGLVKVIQSINGKHKPKVKTVTT